MESEPAALSQGKYPLLWSLLGWVRMKRRDVSQLGAGSPNMPSMRKALGLVLARHDTGPSVKGTGKGSRVTGCLQLYRSLKAVWAT